MDRPRPWDDFAADLMLQHATAASPVARMRIVQVQKARLIAIVDDDAAVREALGDLLQVAGFRGVAFGSAAEFLSYDAPGRFSLVITDLRMPHIDGIELLRRLRAGGATMPAIVVTSCLEDQVRAQALAAGAVGYLTKPVDENLLLQCISAALGRDAGADLRGK